MHNAKAEQGQEAAQLGLSSASPKQCFPTQAFLQRARYLSSFIFCLLSTQKHEKDTSSHLSITLLNLSGNCEGLVNPSSQMRKQRDAANIAHSHPAEARITLSQLTLSQTRFNSTASESWSGETEAHRRERRITSLGLVHHPLCLCSTGMGTSSDSGQTKCASDSVLLSQERPGRQDIPAG